MLAGGGAGNSALGRFGARNRADGAGRAVRSRHILATTAAGEAAPRAAAISFADAPADHSFRASDRRSSLQKDSGGGTALAGWAGMN